MFKNLLDHFIKRVINNNKGFLAAAIPIALQAASMFMKPKKTTQGVQAVADPYGGVRKGTSGYLEKGLESITKSGSYAPQAYTGQKVAPLSSQEQRSLSSLDRYAGGKPSNLFQAGSKEIEKTLSGDYDPVTSPYYQAVKAEAARNLKDTQANIADQSAGAGRFWTGARLKQQGEAATESSNSLNKILAELSLNERQNRLNVLPQAMGFGTREEEDPLRKTAALQQYGQLPRGIEQAVNTADMNDWLRVNVEQPNQIINQASEVQGAPLYAKEGYEPSKASSIFSGIGDFLGTDTGGKALSGVANLFKKKKSSSFGFGANPGVNIGFGVN